MNHVIRIVEVTVKEFCETMCYMEPDCVSINLDKRAGGRGVYRCELNNVTHEGHEDELTNNASYFYHAAEVCPCFNICICFFYHNVNMFASLKKKCLESYQ